MSVKVGDKIRITNSWSCRYHNGDIYEVKEVEDVNFRIMTDDGVAWVCVMECEIITNEEDDNMKAEKGDLIRITNVPEGWAYEAGGIFEVDNVFEKGHGHTRSGVNFSSPDLDEDERFYAYDDMYVIHRKAGEEDSDIMTPEQQAPSIDAPEIKRDRFREAQLQITEGKTPEEAVAISMAELRADDTVVAGVGPDAPIVTNEQGAKQSASPYRMDLIDAKALLKIAQVHKQGGDKYGDTNWRGIPINDHINHALVHVYAHLAGDTSDEHISHAATRLIFALALELDAK